MAISCNCKSLCPKLWHSLKSLNCWSFRVRVSDVSDVSGQSTGLPGHSRQRRPKLWGGHCCENPAVPLHLSGSADAGQMQMSWDELKSLESLESLESLVIWIICQSYVNHMSIMITVMSFDHLFIYAFFIFLYLSFIFHVWCLSCSQSAIQGMNSHHRRQQSVWIFVLQATWLTAVFSQKACCYLCIRRMYISLYFTYHIHIRIHITLSMYIHINIIQCVFLFIASIYLPLYLPIHLSI